jgi:CRISPR/Cas system CMR-associated protein Cmr5 small subunit
MPITRQQERAQIAAECILSLINVYENHQELVTELVDLIKEFGEKDGKERFKERDPTIREEFLNHLQMENEYSKLAKQFPALVHTSGLVQAVAHIAAKDRGATNNYLIHLMRVMKEEEIVEQSRTTTLLSYQRLTREAIESASWLKRYSEALIGDDVIASL